MALKTRGFWAKVTRKGQTGQTGQTKFTLKLEFPPNLRLAALAFLGCFNHISCLFYIKFDIIFTSNLKLHFFKQFSVAPTIVFPCSNINDSNLSDKDTFSIILILTLQLVFMLNLPLKDCVTPRHFAKLEGRICDSMQEV